MIEPVPLGQVITFYSYKGGTGRTMALANVACVLAQQQREKEGKGVLMVDWDLEAPGLHRFFRDRSPGRLDPAVAEKAQPGPGLIDLAYELERAIQRRESARNEQAAREVIEEVGWRKYVVPTSVTGLDLIRAGSFDLRDPNAYAERVNKFDWESLYNSSPQLLRVLAETWAKHYAFVLIDSRTGVTDTSGICTTLLPEKLVVVFTPNMQSLGGGIELIRRATSYRRESSDLRPLVVFPLVSRVEANEPDLRHDWRFGSDAFGTNGYQHEFERTLEQVYGKPKASIQLSDYFDEMQIQHIPRFAYGEEIAVLVEKTGDKFSLRRSYESFARRLSTSQAAWGDATATKDPARSAAILGWGKLSRSLASVVSRPPVLAAVGGVLVTAAVGTGVLANRQQHALTSARADLEAERVALAKQKQENVDLNAKLEKLQQPLDLLQKKDTEIQELYQKLGTAQEDLNKARGKALEDKAASDARILDLTRDVQTHRLTAEQTTSTLVQVQNQLKICRRAKSGTKGADPE